MLPLLTLPLPLPLLLTPKRSVRGVTAKSSASILLVCVPAKWSMREELSQSAYVALASLAARSGKAPGLGCQRAKASAGLVSNLVM
jgi:hypothetical protein